MLISAEYALYQWLRKNAVARLGAAPSTQSMEPLPDVWKERSDAQASLKAYLVDKPSELFL